MSILIVCSHADDEIWCAATIKKLSATSKVSLLVLADGVTSRMNEATPQKIREEAIFMREKNCTEAADIIGISDICFSRFPDQRLDSKTLLEIVQEVERFIKRKKPHTIYTHSSKDLNLDHVITLRAVLTATRPINDYVQNIYAFESFSSTEWNFSSEAFKPNVFEAINEEQLAAKQEALSCYSAEIRYFPHPRSLDAIYHRARWWGAVSGSQYAEAFELIRSIKV